MSRIFTCVLVIFLPLRTFAAIDCNLVSDLDRAFSAHILIAENAPPPVEAMIFLRSTHIKLDAATVQNALRTYATDDQLRTIVNAATQTTDSIIDLRTGHTPRAQARGMQSLSTLKMAASALRLVGDSCRTAQPAKAENNDTNADFRPIYIVASIIGIIAFAVSVISVFAVSSTRKTKRAQRYPCHIKTIVQIDDDSHDATLFDISREGAKVKFHSGPNSIDRPMSVHLQTGAISAQKMWANAHYCGLKFSKPLSKSELATLVPSFFA